MTLPIDTLIRVNNSKIKWYPQSVDTYRSSINLKGEISEYAAILSNFAYSMQYIEYLEKQIRELRLSEVILTMIYKSYIIHGVGIIEGIFCNLIKGSGLWSVSSWKEVATISSNARRLKKKKIKIETIIFEEVDAYDVRMDLDALIKKIETKRLLILEDEIFSLLRRLRVLRNRVHIQISEKPNDQDYNNFGYEEIQMMRKSLYTILTCKEICRNNVFEFLNPIIDDQT